MNVFELGIIAAPVSGLAAGIRAASGHGSGTVVACALGGVLIGAAAYFGPVLASGYLWSRVRDPDAPAEHPGAADWITGTTVVLMAMASPFIAWFVASYAISRLIGLAG
jgi:hypothetical protein